MSCLTKVSLFSMTIVNLCYVAFNVGRNLLCVEMEIFDMGNIS